MNSHIKTFDELDVSQRHDIYEAIAIIYLLTKLYFPRDEIDKLKVYENIVDECILNAWIYLLMKS